MNLNAISSSGLVCRLLIALFVTCLQGTIAWTSRAQETDLQPIPVELKQQDGHWKILRGGKPIYVRGAGGTGSLDLLKTSGGNSNRLWGVDDKTHSRLDEAHRKGISVALGIWLEHERHGFDYSDEAQVAKQFDAVIDAVKQYKGHPAVLVWGIGNEMENVGDGDNPNIWNHIEKLAATIKKIDPNHPTMTVIAGVGGKKVQSLHDHCPSIDIVGINSYGQAQSLPEDYRRLGGTKPYIVTEFGPRGTWEVQKNSIGSLDEETSTEKAETYKLTYQKLKSDQELCLGSYAFLWGNKQEGTATWFGLLLPDGTKTAAVDTLSELWSGVRPENLCPRISELSLIGENEVQPGASLRLELKASDPEGKPLNVRWVLSEEASSYVTGGDFQETPKSLGKNVVESANDKATIRMPDSTGLYRIYAYVDDGAGGGAVANLPVRVSEPGARSFGAKADLPFVLYDEPNGNSEFIPSGWMGSTESMSLDPRCNDDAKFGSHCLKFEYSKADNWGGVVWQHPDGDWGEKPGGFDLTGAKRLSFWARGGEGGEQVKFGFGILGREKKYFDTAKDEMTVKLVPEWKQYTFELGDADLKRIKSGFYLSVAGQGKPLNVFLDNIMFE